MNIPDDLTPEQAVIIVNKLLGKGILKIIRADHLCMPRGRGEPKKLEEILTCANWTIPSSNPYHYRLEEVVGIEVKGKYVKVWGKEGSFTYGLPSKVIRKVAQAALVSQIQASRIVENATQEVL